MNPVAVSGALAAANLLAVVWAMRSHPVAPGAILVAIVAAIGTGAVVQRLRFGRRTDRTARFDPLVTIGFIAAFDVVLAAAVILRA